MKSANELDNLTKAARAVIAENFRIQATQKIKDLEAELEKAANQGKYHYELHIDQELFELMKPSLDSMTNLGFRVLVNGCLLKQVRISWAPIRKCSIA